MRVVLDTNVLVSAIVVPVGPSGQLVGALRAGTLEVVTTAHLWDELLRALSYERVQRFLAKRIDAERLGALLDELEALIDRRPDVAPTQRWVKGDPDDDWVIQCAVTAEANYIVSGDRALRALEEIEGIPVVSPAQMVTHLEPTP